jgi:hypothetical protein
MDPEPMRTADMDPIAGLNTHVKATRAEETRMLHPFMTQESVRQRRAAQEAEARNQRVVRQLQLRTRTDPERSRFAATPERGRFAATARTLAHQVRALVARAT